MKKVAISIVSVLTGIVAGAGAVGRTMRKSLTRESKMAEKHLELFLMMNQWVKIKQEGRSLAEFFERNGYERIAIYGMSYAGETLLDELDDTDVEVVYGIDKNAGSIYLDLDIFTMEDELEKPDAVVVTAISFFDELEEELGKKLCCPILSLEDILYEF